MRSAIRTASEEKGEIKYMTHKAWDCVHERLIDQSHYTWPHLDAFGDALAGLRRREDRRYAFVCTKGLPLVWRKAGPGSWLVVLDTHFEHDPWYDGSLWGVSAAVCDRMDEKRQGWTTGFYPYRTAKRFQKGMRDNFRFPHKEAGRHSLPEFSCPVWEPRWPVLKGKP
jgi:hypothetical protein